MSSLHAGRPFAALVIPPGLYLVANGSRGYGLVGLLLWTATSYSIRHFRVRAWRRCANQERRPARPDLLEGGKGLVPLRVALSPLHLPAEKLAESVNLISSAPASRFGAERGSA